MIKQRLKDIELHVQRWLSEKNNDARRDANQSNKMRTLDRLFKAIDNYNNVKITYIRSPIRDTE